MRQEMFRADDVTLSIGEIRFLDMLRLHVFSGEIHGVFFSDQHGKSEFVDIVTENRPIEYGNVYVGERLTNTYRDARPGRQSDVALIGPVGTLIDEMTVAENVFVIRDGFRKYIIDPHVLREQFARVAQEYGVDIDGGRYAYELDLPERYLIQLLKAAFARQPLVIVRDISTFLSGTDLDSFNSFVKGLAGRGTSFLFIDDNYETLFSVCDRITVTEKGHAISTFGREDFHASWFEKNAFDLEGGTGQTGDEANSVLYFQNVCTGELQNLRFGISEGESVLLWMRSEASIDRIADLIARRSQPDSGHLLFQRRRMRNLRGALPISFIDESPTQTMLFPEMSYMDNLCFHAGERVPTLWRRSAFRRSVRAEYIGALGGDIDAPSLDGLSNKSIYNLVYYREILFRPVLTVLIKPFLNTDKALKQHIISLIGSLRAQGTALLILDNSLSSSAMVADRLLGLSRSGKVGEVGREGVLGEDG
jgi:ribose transport system ATP-binding protein